MAVIADSSYSLSLLASDWNHCRREIAGERGLCTARPGGIPSGVEPCTVWQTFARSASLHSHRTALAFGGGTAGYAQLCDSAQALAAGLIEACKLEAGERVAVLAGNRPEWLTASLAIQGAGGVEVPCRPELDLEELLSLLRRLEVVVAFVPGSGLAAAMMHHASELPALRRVIVLASDSPPPGTIQLATVQQTGADALLVDAGLVQRRQWQVRPESSAAIIHTSGTTGEPKAVLLSQQNLLHAQTQLPGELGLKAGERVLLCLPLWHLYGRLIAYVALGCGAAVHFGSFERIEADLQQVRPACFPAFPQVWEKLHHDCIAALRSHWLGPLLAGALGLRRNYLKLDDAARAGSKRGAALVSLARAALWLPNRLAAVLLRYTAGRRLEYLPRLGIAGDASLAPGADEELRALGVTVLQGYGSTEQLVSCLRRQCDNVPGTVGSPLPQVELRVVDRELRPLPAGRIGQFAVSGPNVCLGYATDEALNARSFMLTEGRRWFLTGDLGLHDGTGHFIFVGRLANVLRGPDGAEVYPELTENLLRNSNAIEQAAIYARHDGGVGVLVVPDPRGLPLDPVQRNARLRAEIRRLLRGSGLPERQHPSHFIPAPHPWTVGVELTPTLKLRRQALRIAEEEEIEL